MDRAPGRVPCPVRWFQSARDLGLQREHVAFVALIALGPEVALSISRNQRGDAQVTPDLRGALVRILEASR